MPGRRTRERSGKVVIRHIVRPKRRRSTRMAAMFEPDAESMPAGRLAGLQQDRLRALVDRLLAAGGLQADQLTQAGVTGGGDVTLADLAALPTTSKRDLWDSYPFGLLAVDRSQVVAV